MGTTVVVKLCQQHVPKPLWELCFFLTTKKNNEKEAPRTAQEGVKTHKKGQKRHPRSPKRQPRGPKRRPKRTKRHARGPKRHPRGPKRHPRSPKSPPRDPKGGYPVTPGTPFGTQNGIEDGSQIDQKTKSKVNAIKDHCWDPLVALLVRSWALLSSILGSKKCKK